ncbi:ankyrin repeat-containing protein NPR4 isoform X1 [Cajanus cajan]|nr:ankyrin repeat-containing protein NPR4 isoform X1 [Cajanus cajan]
MSYYGEENDRVSGLYEVSVRGSVCELESLIVRDPLILHKLSLRSFTETPLHVSALLGHFDFTKCLLSHKPQLALELDHSKRTPLHLASAEGHAEIVHVLLQACEHACLMSDQDGRIPLHYAAMRGRREVARELIRAKPESVMVLDGSGKTMLHLCVEHNHLDTLKTLVQEGHVGHNFLNFGDFNRGNTLLHLAVMFKQIQTVRYLLSIPKIREEGNIKNNMGYTALDMLEHGTRDFKSLQMQLMLMDAGIIKNNEHNNQVDHTLSTTITVVPPMTIADPNAKCWSKFLKGMNKFLQHKSGRLEEMRGMLSLVATMISSMTFNVVMNPPGGHMSPATFYMTREITTSFITYNTIAFIASLSVTLLLVSGVPLKNEVTMGILSIGTGVTLTFLMLTYIYALFLCPYTFPYTGSLSMFFSWLGLVGVIVVFTITRLVSWLVKKIL